MYCMCICIYVMNKFGLSLLVKWHNRLQKVLLFYFKLTKDLQSSIFNCSIVDGLHTRSRFIKKMELDQTYYIQSLSTRNNRLCSLYLYLCMHLVYVWHGTQSINLVLLRRGYKHYSLTALWRTIHANIFSAALNLDIVYCYLPYMMWIFIYKSLF